MKLNEDQIKEKLVSFDGWAFENSKWIVKKYRFREFMQGIQFVNTVARIAEEQDHHPMISIDFKLVTLKLTSWHASGLTELDFTAAASYDQAHRDSM